MIAASDALNAVPAGLRNPLLAEYSSIVQNYFEGRWSPSELSGGRFCEIVYTILLGHSTGTYAAAPSKPDDFVGACRALEKNKLVPRSFQILIPRLLPALYEIRNNRGVGHVGGDVDPNHMDATAVLSLSNWVMAELVRVFHSCTTHDAQRLVEAIVERRVPLVWDVGNAKRVLNPSLEFRDQVLLLLAATPGGVEVEELQRWVEYTDKGYFRRSLRKWHGDRLIEFHENVGTVEILPPGLRRVEEIAASGFDSGPASRTTRSLRAG